MSLPEPTIEASLNHLDYPECMVGLIVMSTVGLPGNLLVMAVILKGKGRKSTTTYLLLNLAVADLTNLMLSTTLVTLVSFNKLHEKKTVLQTMFAPKIIANFTLALISVERYTALITPMKLIKMAKRKIITAIFLSWLIAIIIVMPQLTHLVKASCNDTAYYIFWSLAVLCYAVPLTIVVYCYTSILKGIHYDHSVLASTTNQASLQEKKSLVHILVVVTVLFVVCNLPVIITLSHYAHDNEAVTPTLYVALVFLGSISSCLNPYVYSLKSKNYRNQVKYLLSWKANESE